MFIIMFFMALAFGKPNDSITVEADRSNFQKIQIYVDITEVHAPDGTVGTSAPLNILISDTLVKPHLLKNKLQYFVFQRYYIKIEKTNKLKGNDKNKIEKLIILSFLIKYYLK